MKRRQLVLAGAAAAAWATPLRTQGIDPQAVDARPLMVWPRLKLLDGSTLEPQAWHDQAAVLVFWATYCAFCKRHNAHVNKLHLTTQGLPLRVLGVALDTDADVVRRHLASNGYRFPVTLDDGTLRQRLTTRRVIPMTCVLNRQGRLLQAIPGEMAEADVLDLARLVQGPSRS